MTSRLWYPQLDVFDTARRITILLHFFADNTGIEKICIADFFLATPPLLHRTSMRAETRKKFSCLKIPRPEKTFVSYPSAPLLFHKMEPIQREAINALSGKGLISFERLKLGFLNLTDFGRDKFPLSEMCSAEELNLSRFLSNDFAKEDEAGNYDLRRRTGLRRSA